MGIDLLRVERLESWEGVDGAPTVWVVSGVTVEDQPRMLKVRTLKPLHASACERALRTGRLLWVGWRDGQHGAKDMTTVRLDDTAFNEVPICVPL